jgi:hypothetical protein
MRGHTYIRTYVYTYIIHVGVSRYTGQVRPIAWHSKSVTGARRLFNNGKSCNFVSQRGIFFSFVFRRRIDRYLVLAVRGHIQGVTLFCLCWISESSRWRADHCAMPLRVVAEDVSTQSQMNLLDEAYCMSSVPLNSWYSEVRCTAFDVARIKVTPLKSKH